MQGGRIETIAFGYAAFLKVPPRLSDERNKMIGLTRYQLLVLRLLACVLWRMVVSETIAKSGNDKQLELIHQAQKEIDQWS